MAHAQCTRCGETKSVDAFPCDKKKKSGISSNCKSCHLLATLAWQAANPDRLKTWRRERYAIRKREGTLVRPKRDYRKSRAHQLSYLYGMTAEQYDAILTAQGGRCAICGRHHLEFKRALSVDHDHSCCPKAPTCGKCSRGLLCHTCNTTLHSLDTKPDWIEAASKYLKETARD